MAAMAVFCVFCVACNTGAPKIKEKPTAASVGSSKPSAGKVAPTSTINESNFVLSVSPVADYTVGKAGSVKVALTPKGKFHINQEYPMAIELTENSSVTFAKNKLGREDAKVYQENQAEFDVALTPNAAGETQVLAKVSFAVCTPENCMPDERTLALTLAVK